MVGHKVQLE